jgi:hypothetical protein
MPSLAWETLAGGWRVAHFDRLRRGSSSTAQLPEQIQRRLASFIVNDHWPGIRSPKLDAGFPQFGLGCYEVVSK